MSIRVYRFYQSFICSFKLHLAPVLTGPMNGRVIQFFLAAIFCVGVCNMLFQRPEDPIKETQPSGRAEASFQHVESEYFQNCSISPSKPHNYSGFLLSLLVWEVEETDDEKEISDFQGEKESLPEVYNGTAFVDPLRQSNHVSSVPLFIVLHSWKHFLS